MLEKRYELKGLFIWFIGMAIYAVVFILSGTLSRISSTSFISVILTLFQVGALGVMLVGISKLRVYSQRFVDAFLFLIIAFVGVALGLILGMIGLHNWYMSGAVVLLYLAMLFLIPAYIFLILATRLQILGMSEIALQNDNGKLAAKIKSIWVLYWIAGGIMGCGGVLYYIAGFGIGSFLILGGGIFTIVVRILWGVWAKQLYNSYNGVSIPGAEIGTPVVASIVE